MADEQMTGEVNDQQMTPEEKAQKAEDNLAYGMLVGMSKDGKPVFSLHSETKNIAELAMLGQLAERLIQGEIDKEFPNYSVMLNRSNGDTLVRVLGIVGGLASVIDGLRGELTDIKTALSCNCSEKLEEEEKTEDDEKTTDETSAGDTEEEVPAQE